MVKNSHSISTSVFYHKLLKRHCTPEKARIFIFSTKTPSKNMTFAKNRKSKLRLDQKFCQFLFFHFDVVFDKLSKLD